MADADQPPLSALKTNPKFIFFTDFNGTITQQDSNDFMIENFGVGPVLRKEMFRDILSGRRTFRDAFKEMLDSISLPLNEFLSGGMEPVVRALLAHLLGEDEAKMLPILSSNVAPRPGKNLDDEGGWEIAFRDDSQDIAHMAMTSRWKSGPQETDLLFAKAGRDLVTYCENENVLFTTFQTFSEILDVLKNIVLGKLSVEDVAASRA
ncbi:related to Phosphoserine phosphatase [Phialocephala subalpina]|uniref:Related to Phosphoserine phosphatase n=1 Tax=Phialocephala subalpina TaxID=576137 RepID=A0A1L7X1F8_9HELO|nr:related to Phosphoserine phosphatase [Phialocephala subalpina]